ncbi:transporter [Winogradskyella forsetii]|uniref:transporter n=1 Tax=Winogradskyella forsetii TaxID=2686077 RepID=UPI001E3F5E56|nr:transporter [Winogradskyella forsetii]
MQLTKKHILFGIMLFASMFLTFSQETDTVEPIVTDRPDATEASSTVGKGTFQIETGGLFESFEENNTKSENYTYNTILIRYGILDNVELRVGWDFVEGITKVNGSKLDNVTSGLSLCY